MKKLTGNPVGRPKQFEVDREILNKMYTEQQMSQEQIAAFFGCTNSAVWQWLVKYDIPRRANGSKRREGCTRKRVEISKEDMQRMYIEEKLTTAEIGKLYGCGESTVWKFVSQYGLKLDQEEQRQRKLARNAVRFFEHRKIDRGYQYTKKPDHSLANTNGYVASHRIAVEPLIGREVNDEERVHHINLDKKDNSIENLAVLPNQAEHRKVHNYIELVGFYVLGLIDERPEPLVFENQILWGGHYITRLDLLSRAEGLGYINRKAEGSIPATAIAETSVN